MSRTKDRISITAEKLGISRIKPEQREVISHILEGKDAIAIYPVGFGKSAILQIPALLENNRPTIVFEPTISLMYDQVQRLKSKGIKADYISSRNKENHSEIYEAYVNGDITILYIAPERLESLNFRNAVRENPPWLVVVDEVHCVLEWGRSFRPDYLYIGDFIKGLENRPVVLALTATAPVVYREAIAKALYMRNPKIYITSLNRANLTIIREMMEKSDLGSRFRHIETLIRRNPKRGRTIIYCATKDETDKCFNYLSQQYGAEIVECHSFLEEKERADNEMLFIRGERRIMVATTAFGMGIDVPDIRLIIHASLPISPISYYQEIGRAGRDGGKAHCILLYHPDDIKKFESIIENEQRENAREQIEQGIKDMARIAQGDHCIMQSVLDYLDDKDPRPCGHCSVCQAKRQGLPPAGKIERIDTGIDTFEVSINNLKYSQVQKVRKALENADKERRKYREPEQKGMTVKYQSRALASSGINLIRTFQGEKTSNIQCAVNPTTLIRGEYLPPRLYDPTAEIVVDRVALALLDVLRKTQLENVEGSKIEESRLRPSQIDVTRNLWFDDDVNFPTIIKLFYKSKIPDNFRRLKEKMQTEEGQYFCIIADGYATIKAYDKIAHLRARGHLPPELEGKHILRLEVSMKRDCFIQTLKVDRKDSLETMLMAAYLNAGKIIDDYLAELFPCVSDHYRYDETIGKIKKKEKGDKRERMLYLVEHAGAESFNGLDKACRDTSAHFGLKSEQIKRLLEEFDRIGVNPITLPNRSEIPKIKNIRRMIADCKRIDEQDNPIVSLVSQFSEEQSQKEQRNHSRNVSRQFPMPDEESSRDADGFYVLRRRQNADRDTEGFYNLRRKENGDRDDEGFYELHPRLNDEG